MLYHVPNGGLRDKRTGAEMKRLGVKAGVPDLCLPCARGKYHGLYIEMKRLKDSKTTKEQEEWHRMLTAENYKVVTAYNCEEGIRCIKEYINSSKGQV
jgi:hypothetical protein